MKTKNKPAFSLVEIMIAMTIFAMLAVMTVQVFNNTSRMSRKIEIQEYVFTEAEAALSKILREVERST
ncbi:prepilin-type N-terminal cleavage/methylation domain-containing protein, partial [Patescibacteria group bacterium]|nr:prepilin-type N-terminal cleavage/methylation domain-containing protein [Patescibacteria group bacterium]